MPPYSSDLADRNKSKGGGAGAKDALGEEGEGFTNPLMHALNLIIDSIIYEHHQIDHLREMIGQEFFELNNSSLKLCRSGRGARVACNYIHTSKHSPPVS